MKPSHALALLALPSLLAATGCQHFERTSDCRRLARLANPVLSGVDAVRKMGPDNPAGYRDIAARYDWLALAVSEAVPRGRRLGDLALDFHALFHEAAQDSRLFADALESKDPRRLTTARLAAGRTAKHEAQIVQRVAGTCARR